MTDSCRDWPGIEDALRVLESNDFHIPPFTVSSDASAPFKDDLKHSPEDNVVCEQISASSELPEDEEPKTVCERQSSTPYFARSLRTRSLCIIGLIFSYLYAVFCIVFGVIIEHRSTTYYLPSWKPTCQLLILAQNIVITVCNETIGYILTISLRWTLQQSGRLDFNSNLRLLSNTSGIGPNAWYSNAVVLIAIVSTYGASSLCFLPIDNDNLPGLIILAKAWIVLGCGILTQACIATWALLQQARWPTWSADVMDTAAACINRGTLQRQSGRALCALSQFNENFRPTMPRTTQHSAYQSHKQVRYVTYIIWAAVLCLLICTATLLIIMSVRHKAGTGLPTPLALDTCWDLLDWTDSVCPGIQLRFPNDATENPYEYDKWKPRIFAWVFILLCTLQTLTTLPLHFAELSVNTSRDETNWRRATTTKGQRRNGNALLRLLGSWQSLTLFLTKPFAHWIYGLSFRIVLAWGVSLGPAQMLYLTIVIMALAVFATVVALWRHGGPQPSSFGHLQTMANLIDEWPGKDDQMFWGDKGLIEGTTAAARPTAIRHAGTHSKRLPPVDMNQLYE